MSSSPSSSRIGGTLVGGLWMLLLAILLSWLPILGPLIAGFIGGRIIASPVKATLIALVPAVLMGALLWVVLLAFDLPVIGAVAGFTALVIIAVQELPLLAGAWFGGSSGEQRAAPTT